MLLLFTFGFSATQIGEVCLDCHDFLETSISLEKSSSPSLTENSDENETQTDSKMHICIGCHCSLFSFQPEISYDFSAKIGKQNSLSQIAKSPPFLEGPFQPPRSRA